MVNADYAGSMKGFNELPRELAEVFADKVSRAVCADPMIDGVQFDIEPFDVSSRNGQYFFYRRIAENFVFSVHEYVSCRGENCSNTGAAPKSQLAYVKTVLSAIEESGAREDPLYLGNAVWAWTRGVFSAVRVSSRERRPKRFSPIWRTIFRYRKHLVGRPK